MLIQPKDATARRTENFEILNYVTSALSPSMSLGLARLRGQHARSLNIVSERAYYIMEGSAQMEVGSELHEVRPGDVIYIPKNTPHSITGDVSYIVVNTPAFDPSNERAS